MKYSLVACCGQCREELDVIAVNSDGGELAITVSTNCKCSRDARKLLALVEKVVREQPIGGL